MCVPVKTLCVCVLSVSCYFLICPFFFAPTNNSLVASPSPSNNGNRLTILVKDQKELTKMFVHQSGGNCLLLPLFMYVVARIRQERQSPLHSCCCKNLLFHFLVTFQHFLKRYFSSLNLQTINIYLLFSGLQKGGVFAYLM